MTKKALHEIEFKWSVKSQKEFSIFLRSAKQLGAQIGPAKQVAITDIYLDSPGGVFAKSGIKTRIRLANRRWEFTQKRMSALRGGLARRREKTIALPRFNSSASAIRHMCGKFLKKSLAGERADTLFTIRNRRTARLFKISNNTQAEACFDRVVISRGKRSVALKEIELEFLSGKLPEFKKFTVRLTRASGLKPAKISKVATAVQAFGLRAPHILPKTRPN